MTPRTIYRCGHVVNGEEPEIVMLIGHEEAAELRTCCRCYVRSWIDNDDLVEQVRAAISRKRPVRA